MGSRFRVHWAAVAGPVASPLRHHGAHMAHDTRHIYFIARLFIGIVFAFAHGTHLSHQPLADMHHRRYGCACPQAPEVIVTYIHSSVAKQHNMAQDAPPAALRWRSAAPVALHWAPPSPLQRQPSVPSAPLAQQALEAPVMGMLWWWWWWWVGRVLPLVTVLVPAFVMLLLLARQPLAAAAAAAVPEGGPRCR